jgi:hypothetical protein
MRRGLVLAGALAVLAAGASLAGARTDRPLFSAPKPRVLQVAGRVSDLSADGGRVAFHTRLARKGHCERVLVWTPPKRPASFRPDCGHEALLGQLTLAGTRALWVDYDTGNHVYCLLMTATLARRTPTELPECDPTDQDRELHGLAGDAALLAFDSWYDCASPGATCSTGTGVYDVELWRVAAGKLTKVGSGGGARTVVAVDSGRILLRRPDGTLVLLRADGKQLRTFPFARKDVLGARLQGAELVVRTRKTLDAYDAATGKQGKSWPLATGTAAKASLRDLQSGVALYLAGGVVHLLRLRDGYDRAFRAEGKLPILDAELEASGLFYSYDLRRGAKPGRIAFARFGDLFPRARAASAAAARADGP